MLKKMLLDKNELNFAKSDLPLLIHADDGYGASLFSVSVMADLYAQNTNIVFLCGYHMARDEFDEQTDSKQESIIVTDEFNTAKLETKRVIFIPSEKPELLVQVVQSLSDSNERVIFFKNFYLFESDVFLAIKDMPNLVLMGNIDKCAYKAELLNKKWATQVYLSVPQTNVGIELPEFEKYHGYLKSEGRKGIVSVA